MKKYLLLAVLVLASSTASAAVLCQSVKDPNFRQWFEGYQCPAGFYMIKTK